jgi:hypothetical protein
MGRATVTLDELDSSDPLYPLAEQCADGDLSACDTLYQEAPIGSEFEEFGASCGDTFAGPPGNCSDGGFGFEPVPGDNLNPFVPDDSGVDDKSLEIGLMSLFLGLVYLAGLYVLDQAGNARLATAFVLPAGAALFTGTELLGNAAEHAWVGGVLTFFGGLAFGVVGHLGGRRFTAWAGGFIAGVGAITVALDAPGISDTTSGDLKLAGPGLLVMLFGAGLVALAYAVAQWFQSREAPGQGPGPLVPGDGGGAPSVPPGPAASAFAPGAPPPTPTAPAPAWPPPPAPDPPEPPRGFPPPPT